MYLRIGWFLESHLRFMTAGSGVQKSYFYYVNLVTQIVTLFSFRQKEARA